MSVTTPAPAGIDAGAPARGLSPSETCPLCRSPLRPEQDWCLRCGAGARTRLAAPAKWKALAIALALIVVLSLGVLAAALIKLAG